MNPLMQEMMRNQQKNKNQKNKESFEVVNLGFMLIPIVILAIAIVVLSK